LIKKPGETLWQFPGGFIDKGETFEQAAAREMMEETQLAARWGWTYVKDFMIDDWRLRGVTDADHRTILLIGASDNGEEPVASDDVEEAKFFNFYDLIVKMDEVVKPNHRKMLETLAEFLAKNGTTSYIHIGFFRK
jgi:ADP-ribose pyrophosphatase YjhB (NUDIX family)